MADIHVHVAEGEQSIYPEEQIPELLQQGILTPETYYWKEGMADWRLLTFYKPPAPTIVPERRTARLPDATGTRPLPEARSAPLPRDAGPRISSHRYRFRRKPEPLSTILQVLLILTILVTGLELIVACIRLAGIWNAPATQAIPPDNDDLSWGLEWAGLAINLILLIPYCMWVYRTTLNCRNFSTNLTFKPKWAVGCHFVPVMNLVRPYEVMQALWKTSSNPTTWQAAPSSVLVGVWWTFGLLTFGLAETSFVLSDWAMNQADLIHASFVFIGLKVVQIIWYGIFLSVTSQILRMQYRLVKHRSKSRPQP